MGEAEGVEGGHRDRAPELEPVPGEDMLTGIAPAPRAAIRSPAEAGKPLQLSCSRHNSTSTVRVASRASAAVGSGREMIPFSTLFRTASGKPGAATAAMRRGRARGRPRGCASSKRNSRRSPSSRLGALAGLVVDPAHANQTAPDLHRHVLRLARDPAHGPRPGACCRSADSSSAAHPPAIMRSESRCCMNAAQDDPWSR